MDTITAPTASFVVDDTEDINVRRVDPAAWLALDSDKIDDVTLPSGHVLRISSLTDGETERISKLSERPIPGTKTMRMNITAFKRNIIAKSVNKAAGLPDGHPDSVSVDQLAGRPVGELNVIMAAVLELSGQATNRDTDPAEVFG